MYHSVFPDPHDLLTVSPQTFEQQMKFLRQLRYSVLTLDEAVDAIRNRKYPARSVVITFDDGYKDNFTYAFPVLKKYRIPAAVFLIYAKVGTPGYLTWDEVRQMQDSGLVVFCSHTLTHKVLTLIPQEEAAKEISESKKLLADKLGRPVEYLAYPVGAYDGFDRKRAMAAGYKAAFCTNPRGKVPDSDLFAIKRMRISEKARNPVIFLIQTNGQYNALRNYRKK
jgi:peptidoglycan/xylan/chitin deacetylase (PgdA/CDA1 family)